jgi:hypothetical protein
VAPNNTQTLMWMKYGEHKDEADRICAQNRAEHGGRLEGEPYAWTTPYSGPEGVITVLEAKGPWWREYMTVHRGWVGPATEDQFLDFIDPEPPL